MDKQASPSIAPIPLSQRRNAEEQAAHEAKLQSIMKRKPKHGFYWNLATHNNENSPY